MPALRDHVRLKLRHAVDLAGGPFELPGMPLVFGAVFIHQKDGNPAVALSLCQRGGADGRGNHPQPLRLLRRLPAGPAENDHSLRILRMEGRRKGAGSRGKPGGCFRKDEPLPFPGEGELCQREKPAPQQADEGADQHGQNAETGELEHGADDAAGSGNRVQIPVSHRRQGGEAVPQGQRDCPDTRVRGGPLHRREQHQQGRVEGCGGQEQQSFSSHLRLSCLTSRMP